MCETPEELKRYARPCGVPLGLVNGREGEGVRALPPPRDPLYWARMTET